MRHAHRKHIHANCLMYAVGRQANTDLLNLEAAGLSSGPRGKLEVALPHGLGTRHEAAAQAREFGVPLACAAG